MAFGGVFDRLSARLETSIDSPVALGLSGGSDSLALLKLATDWGHRHGRRILALTVDHGLNLDSARWNAFARDAALTEGADWRSLTWIGPKPATGLPAAARRARHALLAEAARQAGAHVILLAHTADDISEADWMRAEGSTLGQMREWSPSPVWPEGRGLMLLRPLLEIRRQDLRNWLAGQGASWIDDPANDDVRYARSRARASLLPLDEDGSHAEPTTGGGARTPSDEGLLCLKGVAPDAPTLSGFAPPFGSSKKDGCAAVRSGPLSSVNGILSFDRSVPIRTLATALVCAGGGKRTTRGDRLATLVARLAASTPFTATLCGARIDATPDHIHICREAGEFTRGPPPDQPLITSVETIWDGRWAITVDQPGWTVTAAAGRMASLSKADRAILKTLPPAARGSQPVLIRNAPDAAVLAGHIGQARSLVEQRLSLALDAVTHERHLS